MATWKLEENRGSEVILEGKLIKDVKKNYEKVIQYGSY
jgi:hypothetical protein